LAVDLVDDAVGGLPLGLDVLQLLLDLVYLPLQRFPLVLQVLPLGADRIEARLAGLEALLDGALGGQAVGRAARGGMVVSDSRASLFLF